MPSLSKIYLLSYNSLQFFGWFFPSFHFPFLLFLSLNFAFTIFLSLYRSLALFQIIGSLVVTKSFNAAYASSGELICLLQTLSFLEVIHAAIGLVPSGVILALMQWGGRTHFLLAIVRRIAEVQDLPSVFITFMMWSIAEAIRYSHYATSSIGLCPSWLTYLRYTAFIILYPIGVAPGEMWLMYQALPIIEKRNLYSNYFDKLPFSYYSFVVAVLICYPVLWLKLYLHLFKQRRSKLGKNQRKKKL